MQSFSPTNLLESALLDAQAGNVTASKLFESLLTSQVFVLVNKDPGPSGTWSNDSSILVLRNQANLPVMAVFTSPERSTGWPERAAEYKFGLLTDFQWLLKGIAQGVGIVLNPGLSVGAELAPGVIAQLKEQAASKRPKT